MPAIIFIIIAQNQNNFQVSAWNRFQSYIEQSTYRFSFRDLCYFDLSASSFRLGGRFLINESARYDTMLGERLAQRFFEYDNDPVSVRLGNFYETFGQGMVLNSFEDEALRVDWNIDGIDGKLTWDRLNIKGLVGRPRVDNDTKRYQLISGGEVVGRPFLPYELGFSYLRFDATNTPNDSSFGMPVEERMSVEQKLSAGPFQFVAEAGRRFTWGHFDPKNGWVGTENVNGYGLYGAVNFGMSGIGALAEAKDYYKFDGEFNALPSCNKTGKSLNRGNDELGYRTMVEVSPKDFLTLGASLGQAWARNGRQKLDELAADLRADAGFAIVTPSLVLTRERAVESSYPIKDERTSGLDLLLGPVAVTGEYRFITDSLLSGPRRNYTDQKLSLGYTFGVVTVAGDFESTDKPPDVLESGKRWASVSINLRLANHNLQASYGSHRGQLECSTGICHWEPPFTGLKVELESRF